MSCDVFISYRRKDGTYPAMMIHRDLVDAGYDVFYDVVNIGSGEFPEYIEENIKSCTDFLLVVTKNTFSKRILDENDWVYKEIKFALDYQKNIIPIFIGNVSIPKWLPAEFEIIKNYQSVSQIDPKMFHDINKRMFKEYLHSPFNPTDITAQARTRCSIYDASYGNEFERLQIQAENSISSDTAVFNAVVDKSKKYTVLDVGCAYGFVGRTRFGDTCFTKTIGIDKNVQCLNIAMEYNNDDKFSYYLVDLEDDSFEENMERIMEENNISGFDIVFAALVMHHLKNPQKSMKRLKKYMNDGGIIIVRGSDDGSKLAYNDNGLMKQIIDLTTQTSNVSDRFNGRKIYTQLSRAGFKDIKMYSFMRDISDYDFESRARLFTESFSYRLNYVRRQYENDPRNISKKANFDLMEELLVNFENRFYDSSFWYCEYDYVGIGKK